MAIYNCFSSQHSIASPNGSLIATLEQSYLSITSSHSREVIWRTSLPQDFVLRCRYVRWCAADALKRKATEAQGNGQCEQAGRILLADNDTVRIYDVSDPAWHAVIEKAAGNLGRIAEVAFGHTTNEVVVLSDFGAKLTIWSLLTSRGVEVRDPKYMVKCYSHRPRTGHLAILTRPAAQDILMLLQPGNYELIKSVEMSTIDAQEVVWSPDGNWLAIADAANSGYKVLIYTADGHLYKTISNSFSPIAKLHHPAVISLPQAGVWEEQVNNLKERSYVTAPQPASPPTSLSLGRSNNPIHGVSVIAFNSDETLVATKNDFLPTTVWIWSLNTRTVIDVLVHHSPIKQIMWHPSQSDLLLIHCAISEPVIHLWKTTWHAPRILLLSLPRIGGRLEAGWLEGSSSDTFNIMISSAHQYTTTRISSDGDLIPETIPLEAAAISIEAGAEDMFDEGNSLDLSPIKISHSTVEVSAYGDEDDRAASGFGFTEEMLDDTFHYRRHVKAVK